MTKKTNPIGFRLSTRKNWTSSWFTLDKKEFTNNVFCDYLIRKNVEDFYKKNIFSSLHIKRADEKIEITIVTDNVLALKGRNNELLSLLKKRLDFAGDVDIVISHSNFITARYVSGLIASMISTNKLPWKIVMRKLTYRIMEQNPKGYRIELNGRLNNADKHKRFRITHGNVSSNTINNNLDYSCQVAVSRVGTISVKTWINY